MFNAKIGPISERAQARVPKSPQFYAEMPYALEVDDHTVRTRDNALMMSLEVQGIDGITASDRDILDLAKSFAAIMDGRQRADLSVNSLIHSEIPASWAEQERRFGA